MRQLSHNLPPPRCTETRQLLRPGYPSGLDVLARPERNLPVILMTHLFLPFLCLIAVPVAAPGQAIVRDSPNADEHLGTDPTAHVVAPFETASKFAPPTQIDLLVGAQLRQLGIVPAPPCSDAVFVRRVYLDLTGRPPTGVEARRFISDTNPQKRVALVEMLLATDEFTDYWAMHWADVLRIKAEFPINLWPNAAQAYHRWLWQMLRTNLPYDRLARALLTASGSNFRVPPVNFYRAVQARTPSALAGAVALTFMGMRPDRLPLDTLNGLASFFENVGYKQTGEWKEEIVFFNPDPTMGSSYGKFPRRARFPDGTETILTGETDPRQVFADWLVSPTNRWFARCAVNRVWAWLMGRGIIHEPDDIRPDNPPTNPELIQYLESEFIGSGFDLRHLIRLIACSQTYQRSFIARADPERAETYFAVYPLRRLEAEVLIDAINQVTGSTEKYVSPIPEPFTHVPEGERAVRLPDASITSAFLELFARSPRDTGLMSERITPLTAAQRLHMLNSSHIRLKIESSKLVSTMTRSELPWPEAVLAAYMEVLNRPPTPTELSQATRLLTDSASRREAAVDLVWALLNTIEFMYRH